MKKFVLILAVFSMLAFNSCGGGGGTPTPTPTPTSTNTKVTSEAAISSTSEAAFATAANVIENLGGPTAMVVKTNVEKEAISQNFTYTYNCPPGGTVDTAGNVSGQCSETGGGNWSCSSLNINISSMQFNDCMVTVTVDSVDYDETVNGTGSSILTGSVSGTATGIASVNVNGTATANLDVTGGVNGTAVMNLTVTVSGVPDPEPDITCGGTVDVTTDSTTQVCTINTDCSSCVL